MFLKHLKMGFKPTHTQPCGSTHPSTLHGAGIDFSIAFHPQPRDGSAAVLMYTVPYAAPSARCLLRPGRPIFPCTSGISLIALAGSHSRT